MGVFLSTGRSLFLGDLTYTISMPPSQASSFIPKRNPVNQPKSVRRYNFVIIPVISYSVFMASLLAAGVLFIYQIRVESQFSAAVKNLEDQIGSFNDADLSRVVDFNSRLQLANSMVASHVSLGSLLSILETATAETVQFKNLKITRTDEHTVAVNASLVTSSLDGALFQRATYGASSLIAQTKLSAITLVPAGASTDAKTPSAYSFGAASIASRHSRPGTKVRSCASALSISSGCSSWPTSGTMSAVTSPPSRTSSRAAAMMGG